MLLWVRRVAWLHSHKVEGLSRVCHSSNQRVDAVWPQGWVLLVMPTDFGLLSPTNLCQIVLHHPGMSTCSSIDSTVRIGHHLQQQSNACSHSIHRMLVTQALLLFPNPLFSSRSPTLQLTSGSVIRIQVHPASNARS